MNNAIECRGLSKSFGKTVALSGLDLSVREGELYALLGVNGAGKSTAIRILSGLIEPDGGEASIFGLKLLRDNAKIKEKIALSPQETSVAPNLSVRENLELIGGIFGLSGAKLAERISEISEKLSLESVMDRRAGKLSGGFQRRLSIAMALISEPQLLFLDEPTLGLDIISRSELWNLIRGFSGKTTVILTTHYMEEAEALSDRIGIMKDGRVIAEGSASELKALAGAERFEDAFIKIVTGERTEGGL